MSLKPLVAALAFAVSVPFVHAGETPPAAPPAPAEATKKATIDMDDVRQFAQIFSLVKQAYVEPVDDRTLLQSALKGMLANLDPHSEYLDAKAMSDLNEDTTGSYAGLGIEVLTVEGTLRVIAPIDDSPAARGGIKAGDIIVRIDGKPITAENAVDASNLLRGKPGTSITLSVVHDGSNTPVDIRLTREEIRVASVKTRWIEPGYAYLRISQFQEDTGAEVKRKLAALREKGQAIEGLVLDLRSNPGGLLTAAVEVSDDFLDAGVIVTTKGRAKGSDLSFSATPGDLIEGAPIVLLTDNGTASAAEIVTGALKDNHRALIMGRRTFGKGVVQTVLPLDETHAIKLTTARYYTPSGVSIQAAGIEPDIELGELKLVASDAQPNFINGERDLPNHLKGANEKAGNDDEPAVKNGSGDYALTEATNVLKGLVFQRKPAAAKSAPEKKG